MDFWTRLIRIPVASHTLFSSFFLEGAPVAFSPFAPFFLMHSIDTTMTTHTFEEPVKSRLLPFARKPPRASSLCVIFSNSTRSIAP